MNREQVKQAADAIGRLEALEAAYKAAEYFPHEALPISFPSAREVPEGGAEYLLNDVGAKAFYPRADYLEVLDDLILREQDALSQLGVKL